MIDEAELRRIARRDGVDPMLVDLDYVLGCFLGSLFRRDKGTALCFKGGTCLRKVYYADYRYSEDLDFTLTERRSRDALEGFLWEAARDATDEWMVDFGARPLRVEVVDDEYGKESYQARLYYRGPLRRAHGDPRAIRVDVTTNEVMAFPVRDRAIIQLYSDAAGLDAVRVPSYDILETVAEKMRALGGQRRYAISRDVYDLAQLIDREGPDASRLAPALPAKWEVKGLVPGPVDLERLAAREEEFRRDWEQNLLRLLPPGAPTNFDTAWRGAMALLAEVNRHWPDRAR
jgi:predicted nucleotidyltransferase component of viral defense system